MLSDPGAALNALEERYYVLWDTKGDRGWLVTGQVVALHLVRSYLKRDQRSKDFDFSRLNHINDESPRAAYKVLSNQENLNMVVFPSSEDTQKKSEDEKPAEKPKNPKWKFLDDVVCDAYRLLLDLPRKTREMRGKTGNSLQGWFRTWVGKRWETTVRGWEFRELYHSCEPKVYYKKFRKNPGWLDLTTALDATFLFGGHFGEIMQPRDGYCCPYFKSLPKGENYLAVSMDIIQHLVNTRGAEERADNTVAKLAPNIAWERDVDPFSHPHGQGNHLDKVDPSCFPVQSVAKIHNNHNNAQKDVDLVTKSHGRLYSWKEVDDMNTPAEEKTTMTIEKSRKTGVVVFGNKPDATRLRQLAQANAPVAVGSSSKPTAQQSQAGAAHRSPSTSSVRTNPSVADARRAPTPVKGPAQSPVAPDGRRPSVTSIRSTDSSTRRNAPGAATGPVVERPQASTHHATMASAQRTASVSSVRSTASNAHARAPATATGAEQPQASSPQTLANSTHKTASKASLRSSDSNTRPQAAVPSRPGESTAGPKTAATAVRKPSNSSSRTTSSVDSKATGSSRPQVPAEQTPIPTLKKNDTFSSVQTTSSSSSRNTQSSTAGSTADDHRRRQQRLGQFGAATPAAATTDHRPTSSGPAHTSHSGPDGQS